MLQFPELAIDYPKHIKFRKSRLTSSCSVSEKIEFHFMLIINIKLVGFVKRYFALEYAFYVYFVYSNKRKNENNF